MLLQLYFVLGRLRNPSFPSSHQGLIVSKGRCFIWVFVCCDTSAKSEHNQAVFRGCSQASSKKKNLNIKIKIVRQNIKNCET